MAEEGRSTRNEENVDNIMHTLDAFHISDQPSPNVNTTANINPFDKSGIHSQRSAQDDNRGQGQNTVSHESGSGRHDNKTMDPAEVEKHARRERRRQRLARSVERREAAESSTPDILSHTLPNSQSNVTITGDPNTPRDPSLSASSETGQRQRSRRRYITRDQDDENDPKPSALPSLPTVDTNTSQSRRALGTESDSKVNLLPSKLTIQTTNAPAAKSESDSSVNNSYTHQRQHSQPVIGENSTADKNSDGGSRSGTAVSVRQRRTRSVERVGRASVEVPAALANLSAQGNKGMMSRTFGGESEASIQQNYNSCDNKELNLPANQSEVTIQNTESPGKDTPLLAKLQSTYKLLRSRSFTRDNKKPDVRRRDRSLTSKDEQRGQTSPEKTPEEKDVTLIYESNEDQGKAPEQIQSEILSPRRVRLSRLPASINLSPQGVSNSDTSAPMSPVKATVSLSKAPLSPVQKLSLVNTNELANKLPGSNDQTSESLNKNLEDSHSAPPVRKSRSQEETTRMSQQPAPKASKSLDVYDVQDTEAFRNMSSLKRMVAVTDLDKAMKDRDQKILNKCFGKPDEESASGKKDESSSTCSEHNETEMETDLDSPGPAMKYRSPGKFLDQSFSGQNSPNSPKFLTSNNPLTASPRFRSPLNSTDDERSGTDVKGRQHRPPVTLEDAVKWPVSVPDKLNFAQVQVFEGKMLINWLKFSIEEKHYLRLVLTRHDLNVVTTQFCTCLLAAGVIKEIDEQQTQDIFKSDRMYYWTHTQSQVNKQHADIGKLTPMWPPIGDDDGNRIGQKYTETEHQDELVKVRLEYKAEVEKLKEEHLAVLDKCREEYQNRLQACFEKIALLQQEVERFKKLAGIEEYTQEALSEAEAARMEAGNLTNGYLRSKEQGELFLAVTGTPQSSQSMSQFHTPTITPECVTGNYPINILRENGEEMPMPPPPDELRPTPPPPPAPPAPPPPPPPPPPPLMGGPPPPPPPPLPGAPLPGGLVRKGSSKPIIQTKSPMKPLFWQRIQVHEVKSSKNKEFSNTTLVWEEIEEAKIDIDEVDMLFCKLAIEKKKSPNKPRAQAKQLAKVIEPKRSQLVGILLSSLRMDMSDIEYAILTFDTSQLDAEKLRAIYDLQGTDEEIKKIKKYIDKHPDAQLDKPDQFLYDLTQIPDYSERIFCFIFQQAFQESISVIENKLNNLKMTSEMLRSQTVRDLLGLVLAVGNYMNGGNRTRGQADGFGLEILSRLRDVKTKDNRLSLLQYVVTKYVQTFESETSGTELAKLPIPDPSDINQGLQVNFDEIEKELRRIKKDFDSAEKRAEKVINKSSSQYVQPFKDTMTAFFAKGKQEFKEQESNLKEGKAIFKELVIFYCVKPAEKDKEVKAEYFFSLWVSFCQDFKDLWKKEQQRMVKVRIKEAELKYKQLQEKKKQAPSTRTRRVGGLKDKLASKGML